MLKTIALNPVSINKIDFYQENQSLKNVVFLFRESIRQTTLNTIIGFYRASGNRKLYDQFSYEFNICDENDVERRMELTEQAFRDAYNGHVYDLLSRFGRKSLEYYMLVLEKFFTKGDPHDLGRKPADKGQLLEQLWKQKHICPICHCKINTEDTGKTKLVTDHRTAISVIGDDDELLEKLYGPEYKKVIAVHSECNEYKGSKCYLF